MIKIVDNGFAKVSYSKLDNINVIIFDIHDIQFTNAECNRNFFQIFRKKKNQYIGTEYENKQTMFWFVKNQNSYKFIYGDGTNECTYNVNF